MVFKGDVTYLGLTTPLGSMGIKQGHEALVVLLKEGGVLLVHTADGKETSYPYMTGMLKFSNDDCQIAISMS